MEINSILRPQTVAFLFPEWKSSCINFVYFIIKNLHFNISFATGSSIVAMKDFSISPILILLPLLLLWFPTPGLFAQNTGVGTPNPTHTLHIKPLEINPVKDPIRIENLQPYNAHTDSMILVVNPDSGVVRVMSASALIGSGGSSGDNDPTNEIQDASGVSLATSLDLNQDGNQELTVQAALQALTNNLPKGTFKTIGEARLAGLVDGDSFYAHPEGVFGCGGCIIKLFPGMN